jgi:hypothetical protein
MDDKQLLAEIRMALEAYRLNCADPTKAKPMAALGFAIQVERILASPPPAAK